MTSGNRKDKKVKTIYSPYLDQKIKNQTHKRLSAIYIGADFSRKRTVVFGTILALGWIIGVLHLPPLAKSKSVYPHLGMMALATCITSTTKKNYNNALTAQQESIALLKRLRLSKSHQDIELIFTKTQQISKKYPYYFGNEFFRNEFFHE